jgi:cyclomaltodextrinase / maltogenic alpha-amylase / neopullulanase
VALTMLLTLPGLPALFTGDEVGAAYQPYDEGPPLRWDDPHGLTRFHAQRIQLRRALPALTGAGLRVLPAGAGSPALAYLRPGATPRDHLLVALNFDAAPRSLHIDAVDDVGALMKAGPLTDVVRRQPVKTRAGAPLQILLPPFGTAVIGVSERVGDHLLAP